jgi:hypothetical protein
MLIPSIETHIIQDFIPEDTRQDFIKYVEGLWDAKQYKKEESIDTVNSPLKLDPSVGKAYINLGENDFPPEFLQHAKEHAKKLNPNAEFEYISIVKYSAEYGNPQLSPHFDRPSRVCFLLDYQLDGNVDWPLVMKDEEYIVKNGECLAFDSLRVIHWRKPQQFKKGEYLYVMFYSFVDKTMPIPLLEGQAEEIDKYFPIYKNDLNETNTKGWNVMELIKLFEVAEKK